MTEWLDSAEHWRSVNKAAMELKKNPDSLFAELGRALHQYELNRDRNALADTLVSIGRRMKE